MRILLIEDDQDIVRTLKPSLESECFVVDIAQNGEQGAYLARINHYDVVLLDNMLPIKMGREVCLEIRKAQKTMPIILLSVVNDAKMKAELLNAGADDYVTKPFSFEELLARIRAVLRRPQHIEQEVLRTHDLQLDIRKNVVLRNGREVYLTRKEFMLLEYLMRNKGAVLSRGMIMERVWDMNADPFSNTIESHILSLRKKLNAQNEVNLIITVPNRGYKISEDQLPTDESPTVTLSE